MARTREQPPAPPPDRPAHSLAQFAVALVRNAIPVWGFFRGDWTPATTLAVYWFETLIGSLLIALRMAIHRRLTGKRGYEVEQAPAKITVSSGGGASKTVRMGYATGFLVGALGFTLVHGIFLGVLLGFLLPEAGGGRVDPVMLRQGVLGITALLVLGFLVDLVGLRQRPFAWIKGMAEAAFSRIVIVHLTIIFGMGAAILLNRTTTVFTIFVALKFLADVSAHTPQWRPKQAPAWMSRALNRVGGRKGQEDFASYWKRTQADEDARAAEDELVAPEDAGRRT